MVGDPQSIYAAAYAFYMNGNFVEAAGAYEFLVANLHIHNMQQQSYAGAILANKFAGNDERAQKLFENMCYFFQASPDDVSQYLEGFKTYMNNIKVHALKTAESLK